MSKDSKERSFLELCECREWDKIMNNMSSKVNEWNFKEQDDSLSMNTPLFLCSKEGQLSILQEIYEHHPFDIRETNSEESTLFLEACTSGNIDLVKWMLDLGSKLDEVNGNGETCLLLALSKNHLELTLWLLNNGISPKMKDYCGNSCILLASSKGFKNLVKLLVLEYGCDINDTDNFGNTCLQLACKSRNIELVNWLIHQGGIVDENCLIHAVFQNNLEMVRLLVKCGCSTEYSTEFKDYWNGETCMTIASNNGNLDMIKFLTSKGFSLQDTSTKGSCIIIAAKNKYIETVIWMLSNGSSLEENLYLDWFGSDASLIKGKSCKDILQNYGIYEIVKKAFTTKSSRK